MANNENVDNNIIIRYEYIFKGDVLTGPTLFQNAAIS